LLYASVTFWPSEEGHREAIGSPEAIAEAELDATLLVVVVVGIDWLALDESLVEVSWLEAVLLCALSDELDSAETLPELEPVV
jgi:hypothetical protein